MCKKIPLVSVIVPVYNSEKYVTAAIKSVLNQTTNDWELILVDDGSADNSLQICQDFSSQDSRINVIHKENGGVGSARNTGIDAANGEYVLFLDADDTILPNTIMATSRVAEGYNADLVLFGGYVNYLNQNDSIVRQTPIETPIAGVYWKSPCKKLFPILSDIHMATRQLYRRRVIVENSIHFTDHKIAEDALFFSEYYSTNLSCIIGIPDKLFSYAIRDNGSASQKYQPERIENNFYMSSAIRDAAQKLDLSGDESCNFAVQKAVIVDLQLGIKNICLGDFNASEKTAWLKKQMKIPGVLEAVKRVPVSACGSKNDRIKLLLLKGGFYSLTIALVSRNNRSHSLSSAN